MIRFLAALITVYHQILRVSREKSSDLILEEQNGSGGELKFI